ncbi:MIP family channel protein [Pseudonocardia sp. ICBG601]|uniref:MIP family channel protein n=2 Tax=Pseudonocardia TaxID=1847 RepID=UPI0035ABD39B
MSRGDAGELAAEFAGTFVLILIGCGTVAQVVTSDGAAGDWSTLVWGWGVAVTMGVYVAGRVSGAHLNPAVTLALAVFKGFAWRKVAPYWLAQTAGAFLAALVVRAVYAGPIAAVDPGHTVATQTIFSTLPGEHVSILAAFGDQIVGTALLVFVIFALTNALNNPPGANMAPFMIGFLVVGIGIAFGANAGYAINPARDLGPRLASFVTGYDTAFVTSTGVPYWWLPIVAPLLGGLIGGGAFVLLVERFLAPAELEAAARRRAGRPHPAPGGPGRAGRGVPPGGDPMSTTLGPADYPLSVQRPDLLRTPTGRPLSEVTMAAVVSGEIRNEDLRISAETLTLQGEISDAVGRRQLAENMRRAAELTTVPDEEVLAIYNALRPRASSAARLAEIADRLENDYAATTCAALVREAAQVYAARDLLAREGD